MLQSAQHIHIVGVGGFGMSAIARILLQSGYAISGSDLHANAFTQELAAAGATIYQGHAAEQIAGADVIVATSAATDANPEIAAARAAGIPVLRRQDMLGELMANRVGIAIAGTHGKTTTTALLTHVLLEAGLDPTYIVGGVMRNTGTNAAVGQGAHFVIEADEYDRMFLGLRPLISVITGIEHDHPDIYPTLESMIEAFAAFVALLPDDGVLVACADDDQARQLGLMRYTAGQPVLFYGINPVVALPDGSRFYTVGKKPSPFRLSSGPSPSGRGTKPDHPFALREKGPGDEGQKYQVDDKGHTVFTARRGDDKFGAIRLPMLGAHNVQNALAVIAVADQVGVPFEQISAALATFTGTGRRAEILGTAGDVTIVSDYAHHPTAIRVTLNGFRQRPDVGQLWAVWQPHTYGRLRALADEFAHAFADADHVLVTDVYSVREDAGPGLDAAGIAALIRAAGVPDVRYTGSLPATAAALVASVQPGDWVILLSAGDLPPIGAQVLEELARA